MSSAIGCCLSGYPGLFKGLIAISLISFGKKTRLWFCRQLFFRASLPPRARPVEVPSEHQSNQASRPCCISSRSLCYLNSFSRKCGASSSVLCGLSSVIWFKSRNNLTPLAYALALEPDTPWILFFHSWSNAQSLSKAVLPRIYFRCDFPFPYFISYSHWFNMLKFS